MKTLLSFIITILVNVAALWISAHYLAGFHITGDIYASIFIALAFIVLNAVLRPLIKLLLGPLILITFGLAIFLINSIVLYIVDIFSQNLMIDDIATLVISGLIFGVANFVAHILP